MSLPSSAGEDEDSSNALSTWPPNAEQEYERVKPIGNGAFGKVWAAKRKRNGRRNSGESIPGHEEEIVAIKVISTSGHNGRTYANREVAILQEMDHPHVVNLIKTYNDEIRGGRTVVMSLANGPSLHSILERGGSLGLPLSRLVSRHLIAAVSYLHCRAILHRDIKPQNLIFHIPGNPDWEYLDILWSDHNEAGEEMREKGYKVVLVDLGFARALTKDEIVTNQILGDNDKPRECLIDDVGGGGLSQSMASRVLLRSMSALGSRVYAAPEMFRARKVAESDASCLTEYSADYTFLCDEYACGKTLLEVLSGVPACERDINEYVKQERLAAYFSGRKDKKRHRLLHEIPRSAMNLIRDLTRPSAKERITCWVAQLYPWICGEKGEHDNFEVPTVESVSYRPGDGIVPLGCGLIRADKKAIVGPQGNASTISDQVDEVMKIQVV